MSGDWTSELFDVFASRNNNKRMAGEDRGVWKPSPDLSLVSHCLATKPVAAAIDEEEGARL